MRKVAVKNSARRRLSHHLKRYRALRGLSQEALADIAELHRTYVGGIERGERNVSIDNIERLAHALRLDVTQLLSAIDGA